MLAAAEEQASFSRIWAPICMVLYTAAKKRTLSKTLQLKLVAIFALCIFVGLGHLQHAGAGRQWNRCLRCYVCFIPYHVFLESTISFANCLLFSIPLGSTYSTDDGNEIAPSDILL